MNMKTHSSFTLADFIIAGLILIAISAILVPVCASGRGTSDISNCQSNMKRIGTAIKAYLSNWDDCYPTNRLWSSIPNGVASGDPQARVPLTKLTIDGTENGVPYVDADGNQIIFESGPNWVEALYRYVGNSSKQSDLATAWKCPTATGYAVQRTSNTTYVINYNLLEQPEGVIKNASNLMLLRESDRMIDSEARGYSSSSTPTRATTASKVPTNPFLATGIDRLINAPINTKLHGNGSNILFADGHVKSFSLSYFPLTPVWDPSTSQWYNSLSGSSSKSIAITP